MTTQSMERPVGAQHNGMSEAGGQGAGLRPSSDANGSKKQESLSQEERWANGLGWFSIALGLAEVAAPRGIARLIGVRSDHSTLIRTLGLREIASGLGILGQRTPATALWSRVGGDAIDLACLGAAFFSPQAERSRVLTAGAAVAGVTVLDVLCAQQLSRGTETR